LKYKERKVHMKKQKVQGSSFDQWQIQTSRNYRKKKRKKERMGVELEGREEK